MPVTARDMPVTVVPLLPPKYLSCFVYTRTNYDWNIIVEQDLSLANNDNCLGHGRSKHSLLLLFLDRPWSGPKVEIVRHALYIQGGGGARVRRRTGAGHVFLRSWKIQRFSCISPVNYPEWIEVLCMQRCEQTSVECSNLPICDNNTAWISCRSVRIFRGSRAPSCRQPHQFHTHPQATPPTEHH